MEIQAVQVKMARKGRLTVEEKQTIKTLKVSVQFPSPGTQKLGETQTGRGLADPKPQPNQKTSSESQQLG